MGLSVQWAFFELWMKPHALEWQDDPEVFGMVWALTSQSTYCPPAGAGTRGLPAVLGVNS